jgi:hypothetical protein
MSDKPLFKLWPPTTTITYADAETRGKLRHWKKKLAERYDAFEAEYARADRMSVVGDMVRGSTSTRQRAYQKLNKMFGPGAVNEGVTLQRNKSLAIWSYLKPRNAVTTKTSDDLSEAERASLMQDCVTVNYVIAGVIGARVCAADGLWTLEVPDHALGRAVERSGYLQPEVIIREAHMNLLSMPVSRVNDIHYIKAGPGCFAGELIVSDKEATYRTSIHVRVKTWLDDNMMGDNQVPITEVGARGQRLGDSILLPRPLWLLTQRSK